LVESLTAPNNVLDGLKEKYQEALAVMAGAAFSVDGFAAFYERLHGNPLPEYARNKWIIPIFEAKSKDMGKLLFAFRGSWKTTTISITFTAYFIGHHPDRANLVIGSSGASANSITEAVKNIIEFTDAWKDCFPNIRPDVQRGWGQEGYEVMRTNIPYEEWRGMNTHRKDPTLLGLGVGSKTLIGKHPDGLLLMDDILDEDNTSSVRQMQSVATKVTGTILPFIVEDEGKPKGEKMMTWPVVIGTPWTDDDVYQDIKGTGEFDFSAVPIMYPCAEGEGTEIKHEKLEGWYRFADPARTNIETIKRLYNRSGHKEFMRMYMLDTTVKMSGEGLSYRLYPHDKIDLTWPMATGVDYMSMMRDRNIDLKNRNYYAQAYLFEMPDGRGVIGGGWYGRPTQAEAETRMEQAEAFPGHKGTFFEGDGKGEEALQVFLRNPNLTIIPMRTEGKGKTERLERQLGPWLENGQILISDKDDPFLNFLRKCLDKYPQWHLDPIDAVYWAVRGMPQILTLDKPRRTLPRIIKNIRTENPFHSFGAR